MSEFYKKIREHQSLNTEHELPSDAWNSFKDFETAKDDQENKKRGFFNWPYVAGIIGLLLIGGISLVSYDKNSGLAGMFYSIERDTVYITKYVEIEKEVGQVQENRIISLEQQLAKSQLELAFAKRKQHSLSSRIGTLNSKHDRLKLNFDEINSSLLAYQENLVKDKISISANASKTLGESPIQKESIRSSNSIDLRNDLNTQWIELQNELKPFILNTDFTRPLSITYNNRSNEKRPFYEYLRPKTFSVGADIEMAFPNEFYGTSNNTIVQGGLLISSHFTPIVRGQISYHYGFVEGEEKEPQSNALIPVIQPVEGGILKEVKIRRNVSQVSIGLEYIVYKGNKWRPFLGVSYGMNVLSYPKFIYEYDTAQGEIYQQLDTETPTEYSAFYKAHAGIEYHLLKALDVQLQVGYQYSKTFNSSSRIKTRFLYHF